MHLDRTSPFRTISFGGKQMKLKISDPVVVAMGPSSLTAGWGPYQFPTIKQFDDGRLFCTYALGADSEREYGKVPGCRVSNDGGKTWEALDEGEDISLQAGLKLPNGDRIAYHTWKSIPLEGLKLPEPVGKTWLGHTLYRADEIDESICDRTWSFNRYTKENPRGVREKVTVEWPHMLLRSTQGVLVPPTPRGRLRIDRNGTLWMPHYYLAGAELESGELIPYLCNYLFKSTDGGRTWQLKHFLPFYPDPENPQSERYEGFGENDITMTPDGSLIRLIRTHGSYMPPWSPCFLVRSEDGGETWSEPEAFDKQGVWPCLLTLDCGVTIATYGRPGVTLRATDDPSGKTWGEPIRLVEATGNPEPYRGSVFQQASCGYTNSIALDERTAALVYSDFRVLDEEGTPRKCIMFCTVTVED